MFLRDAPSAKHLAALEAAIISPGTDARAVGSQVYLVYPEGVGRSKLTNVALGEDPDDPRERPQLEHRGEARRNGK